jgi:hypothetical protein
MFGSSLLHVVVVALRELMHEPYRFRLCVFAEAGRERFVRREARLRVSPNVFLVPRAAGRVAREVGADRFVHDPLLMGWENQ